MKRSADYKQKFGKNVGFEADSEGHSNPTLTEDFDLLQVQLDLWKIDRCDFDEADTPEKKRILLLAKGVKPEIIAEFLADLQNGKSSSAGKSPPVLNVLTSANAAPPAAATDSGSRWTVPEAMAKAREKIENYLPHTANDLGWGALAIGKLFGTENRRVTEEQLEQLEKMSPTEKLGLLSPPGVSVAEGITGFIRLNPRSLLNPNTSERLVAALVDLLEAAHFGTCANRFPGLLPTDNRKRAASIARKALGLLAKGGQGNPPDYPPELLASAVGLIQVALAPIKKAWGESNLETIRKIFGDEVNHFTDKKLKSLLTDSLLTAAARLAEEVTGISAESFETAWEKAPSIQEVFKTAIAQ